VAGPEVAGEAGCGGGDHGPGHDSSGPAPKRGAVPAAIASRRVDDERRIVAMGAAASRWSPTTRCSTTTSSRSRAARGRPSPLWPPPAATPPAYVADFYRAFAARDCRLSDVGLFDRRIDDLRGHVLAQDVVYVGGGNTASLLAVWRAHGLDRVLIEAWHAGVVLAGISAGMNCWFQQSVTDSFAPNALAALDDGLGLLAGSACPHFDGEDERRPAYRRLVGEGVLRDGWAADDSAALVFRGEALEEVVASRPGAARTASSARPRA
jgi:dipeptidase E